VSPFFMFKFLRDMWMIPTLLLVSLLIIQGIHVSAHRSMDVDVESYVRSFCRQNKDKCRKIVRDL